MGSSSEQRFLNSYEKNHSAELVFKEVELAKNKQREVKNNTVNYSIFPEVGFPKKYSFRKNG